jgi:hypothetical protein
VAGARPRYCRLLRRERHVSSVVAFRVNRPGRGMSTEVSPMMETTNVQSIREFRAHLKFKGAQWIRNLKFE